MVTNILIIILLVLLTVLGVWRGMARTLLNFAALVLCSVVSDLLSGVLAKWIYTTFFQQGVIENIQQTIDSQGADAAVTQTLNSAPSWITGLLSAYSRLSGISMNEIQTSLKLTYNQNLSPAQNLERPVGELSTMVIALVASFVLFFVLFMLCKPLIRHISKIFRIPVLSQIDRVVGGVLGFIEGVILLLFAVNFFYVVVSAVNPMVLNNTAVFGDLFHMFCFFS